MVLTIIYIKIDDNIINKATLKMTVRENKKYIIDINKI